MKPRKCYLYWLLIFSVLAFIGNSCIDSELLNPQSGTPVIRSVTPRQGPPGTPVTITGENFSGRAGADTVLFNGTIALVTNASSTSLETSVPQGATSGPVMVSTNGRRAIGPDFIVEYPANYPKLTSIYPDEGVHGTMVAIKGENFSADPDSTWVRFGADTAMVAGVSDTLIRAVVPLGVATGPVTLTTGTVTLTGPLFTVLDAPPEITALIPDQGPPGLAVSIIGRYFSSVPAQNKVLFNGVQAVVAQAYNDSLKVIVPANATTGKVTVDVNGRQATGPVFTVVIPAPVITSINPDQGQVGTEVKIYGDNFSNNISENTVQFNGTDAAVTAASQTELTTQVPAGATTGPVTVTVNGQTATGPVFTVLPTPPTITSINPDSGGFDTEVTITGANFSNVLSENTVTFNGLTATLISASDTALVAKVPLGAGTGVVEVTVNGMTATGPVFTYIKTAIVTTIAGSGQPGFQDGQALSAMLNTPARADLFPNGWLLFADAGNHSIRVVNYVDSSDDVFTLTGNGQPGFADGYLAMAQFDSPTGIAVDQNGNTYIADFNNHVIRMITPQDVVTTIAGSGQPGFADGNGQQAAFNGPIDVAVDDNGNVFVADYYNHAIRAIDGNGNVFTIAGNGQPGFTNGSAQQQATFTLPAGIGFSKDYNRLYVADLGNHAIRMIDMLNGNVSTVAGNGTAGSANGTVSVARFNFPYDVDTDVAGNIYVADLNNHKIRIIRTDNTVATLAGTGTAGFLDGTGDIALFNSPTGIKVENSDKIYVMDAGNHRIRIITLE